MSVAIHVDQERSEALLGASEAPGVLGLDKRNPPIKIWRRHRGLAVDEGGPSGEWAEWGQILEPVIRGKYAVKHDANIIVPTESFVRDQWLRCTPDGIQFGGRAGGSVSEGAIGRDSLIHAAGLVQCKNVDSFLAHEWQDDPPPRVEVQARVEMAVTGLPWCDCAALIGGNRYVEHRVERDLEIEARILRDLAAFWDLVQRGVEPTVDHSDQWRIHASEKMPSAKMIVEADEGDYAAMTLLRIGRTSRINAERGEKLARNDILLRLAQRGATALRHPELGTVSAYKTRGTWAVRVPPSWGDDE